MIHLDRVSCAYEQRPALADITVEFTAGQTVAIVGPNSAGKSTLLKAIGGMIQPVAGTITLNNKLMAEWSLQERARWVAWVPSEADFTFPYAVEEMVLLGRTPHLDGLKAPQVRDRVVVREMLELTDLATLAQRSVDELSSGEKQRVLLARALAQEPSVLLLDEPTAHLDIGHSHAFFRALARLRERRTLTVIWATHDLHLARTFTQRVALLQEGRLLRIGSPDDVLVPDLIRTVFKIPLGEL